MKRKAFVTLIALALQFSLYACGHVPMQTQTQDVLGIVLGGSMEDLKTIYNDRKLPFQRISRNRYTSTETIEPLEGFQVSRVEYQGAYGLLEIIEIHIEGDLASELEVLLDEKYSYDSIQRKGLEERYSFIGTIGEGDHFWSFENLGIVVLSGKDLIKYIVAVVDDAPGGVAHVEHPV